MARQSDESDSEKKREWPDGPLVTGAPLEPIKVVERELTTPDGRKVIAKVPVYPPFKLDAYPPEGEKKPANRTPPRKPRGRRKPEKESA